MEGGEKKKRVVFRYCGRRKKKKKGEIDGPIAVNRPAFAEKGKKKEKKRSEADDCVTRKRGEDTETLLYSEGEGKKRKRRRQFSILAREREKRRSSTQIAPAGDRRSQRLVASRSLDEGKKKKGTLFVHDGKRQ